MTTTPTAAAGPRTRISPARLGIVLLCALAVAWAGLQTVSAAVTKTVTPGPSTFAAYVDVTVTPTYPFETPAVPAQANVILSFVVAHPDKTCTPAWGGAYTLAEAGSDLQLDRRISQLRLTGGQARVSFGGQRGDELASTCTDPDDLRRAYQSVVDRYDLTSIDLDIEGEGLQDEAASARRAAAIKEVQDRSNAAGRSLAVWLTLPVAPTGLLPQGEAAVADMLSAGVDLAGVNGMTMDFGVVTTVAQPLSDVVLRAGAALHAQVGTAFAEAGRPLSESRAWQKVGITSMIGQSDVPSEQFTLADADVVNQFARDRGVGLVAMWSLNRDSTCARPLPSVLSVVQTSCSGIDQGTRRFADALASDLPTAAELASSSTAATPAPSRREDPPSPVRDVVDDPAHSPFPIWDPLGTYPGGTKIVWHHQVFEAKYWTSGAAPDTQVAHEYDSPWALVGPVLPGDTPAPLPTLPAGTYPQWDPDTVYLGGTRVQLGLVPYEAKWWSQAQEPGAAVAGGSPWFLVVTGR